MLVFGDSTREADGEAQRVQVLNFAQRIRDEALAGQASLDRLRTLLITTGQFEQGIHDAVSKSGDTRLVTHAASATQFAADAFIKRYLDPESATSECEVSKLDDLIQCFQNLIIPYNLRLHLKTPEGFAHYTLFPEQYACASREWLRAHEQDSFREVIVIGVRSIGTTLSAVVSAVLKLDGWNAHRMSVRPEGHPFARIVNLELPAGLTNAFAIVVDEGPGLSGTSMAATAESLITAGIKQSRVSFFPSHSELPKRQMNETTKKWWTGTPRYVVPLGSLYWNCRTLISELADASAKIMGNNLSVKTVHDIGGGRWRPHVYSIEEFWPAVCAQFERTKYRVVFNDGTSIFWKFAGLIADENGLPNSQKDAERLNSIAESDELRALGIMHGFVARRWIDGVPFAVRHINTDELTELALFLRCSSRPPLKHSEHVAAINRLTDLIECNAQQFFGDTILQRVGSWKSIGTTLSRLSLPQNTGARMATWKWLRLPNSRIVNVDRVGHDFDHTCIGTQSLLWDVASLSVDWSLEESVEQYLIHAIPELHKVSADMVKFMRLSYAAFRAAQCVLCIECGADPSETNRLKRDVAFYKLEMSRHFIAK
jgi:hypothetical protein